MYQSKLLFVQAVFWPHVSYLFAGNEKRQAEMIFDEVQNHSMTIKKTMSIHLAFMSTPHMMVSFGMPTHEHVLNFSTSTARRKSIYRIDLHHTMVCVVFTYNRIFIQNFFFIRHMKKDESKPNRVA